MNLLGHELQLDLLWIATIFFCIITLCCARVPKWRVAALIMFLMGALDISLWGIFSEISGDPNKYKAYLTISSLFILANMFVKSNKLIGKNLIFLITISILHCWEWIDFKSYLENPIDSGPTFIDGNYALLVAIAFFIYTISLRGNLLYAWNYHKLHRYDRELVPRGLGAVGRIHNKYNSCSDKGEGNKEGF